MPPTSRGAMVENSTGWGHPEVHRTLRVQRAGLVDARSNEQRTTR
jgi:hypothetical protein